MRRFGLVLVLSLVVAGFTAVPVVRRSVPQAVAQDPDAAIEQRIDELLADMTIEEKFGQLQMLDADYVTGRLRDDQIEMVRDGTLGSTLNARGAEATNDAQRIAVEESRLGIPLIFGFDVIHGYRTVFPMPLGEASSWDVEDAETSAAIAAKEARAAGVTWTFAPMVDVTRDPRWGRIIEGAGEDQFLGAAFAAARVRGFQGEDYSLPDRVAATAKHWVGYGGAEGGRDYNTVDVSERRLREWHFPPFKAAQEAGVDSFMTAFNEISGIPATANHFTLTDVLRGEWGEDGPMLSDYTAVAELRACPPQNPDSGPCGHGVAADGADAARLALNAGTDVEMVSQLYRTHGPALVEQGLVSMERVDEAVRRVLRLKYRAGLFDDPYVDPALEDDVLLAPEHLAEARRIAARSMVLLKNQGGALPLSQDLSRVAVVGPLADSKADMLGSWTGDGRPEDAVTVLEGVKDALDSSATVTHAAGCDPECTSTGDFRAALTAVRRSQAAIVVLGEPAQWSGEAESRSTLELPGQQLALLQQIHRTGKPYVVVLINNRPLNIEWLDSNAPAILEAWYPGTQAGHAVADVVFGKVNPGGKLPVSWPYHVGQIPIYHNHKNTGRPCDTSFKWNARYIDLPCTALYPFGHGLSYTTFELSNLRLSSASIPVDGSLTVSADVMNTGDVAGDEVVQLYVHDQVASVTPRVRKLRGFERVPLQPGETKTVTFEIDKDDLSFWGQQGEFVVEPGDFDIWVGQSSQGGLHATFSVTG